MEGLKLTAESPEISAIFALGFWQKRFCETVAKHTLSLLRCPFCNNDVSPCNEDFLVVVSTVSFEWRGTRSELAKESKGRQSPVHRRPNPF